MREKSGRIQGCDFKAEIYSTGKCGYKGLVEKFKIVSGKSLLEERFQMKPNHFIS